MSVADYDYGLEDKLLRKNIPGRYSTWEDEEPERRARDEDDSDDIDQSQRDEIALTSNCSEEPSLSRTDGPQTGSKGVLADYREHCRLESEARQEDQAEALNAWRQAAYGSTSTPVPETSNKVDGDVDSELATLRRRRLQEIQATREIKPVFGQVREVNPMEMLSAIDDEVNLVEFLSTLMLFVMTFVSVSLSCICSNLAVSITHSVHFSFYALSFSSSLGPASLCGGSPL